MGLGRKRSNSTGRETFHHPRVLLEVGTLGCLWGVHLWGVHPSVHLPSGPPECPGVVTLGCPHGIFGMSLAGGSKPRWDHGLGSPQGHQRVPEVVALECPHGIFGVSIPVSISAQGHQSVLEVLVLWCPHGVFGMSLGGGSEQRWDHGLGSAQGHQSVLEVVVLWCPHGIFGMSLAGGSKPRWDHGLGSAQGHQKCPGSWDIEVSPWSHHGIFGISLAGGSKQRWDHGLGSPQGHQRVLKVVTLGCPHGIFGMSIPVSISPQGHQSVPALVTSRFSRSRSFLPILLRPCSFPGPQMKRIILNPWIEKSPNIHSKPPLKKFPWEGVRPLWNCWNGMLQEIPRIFPFLWDSRLEIVHIPWWEKP
ncbi:uncharacterized protein LOC125332492 [Corvus hawaiiensis]|uniref:uncharacterized protein LOC125332492 n=1 Tax=Corvus hawaiiensis TaxID=134902 RepID=UPI002019570B|nr:uncharacterized protein LOC125332492 [Corvus hawaiiensis]